MSRGPRATVRPGQWGTSDDGCHILHVDMDAFFASVELVRQPQLAGRPVIVGGGERSVVLAATYEARAFGVSSAMPMSRALRACPQAIVIRPDMASYREASVAVMGILRDVTSVVEQVSVDEAFLDVRGARRRLGPPADIAASIRSRVSAELGLPCSIGVASSKFVAKIASVHAKPDGLLVIPAEATVPFLRSLPVGALWGVGGKTEEVLERFGITTVAQLADTDVSLLQRVVGKAAGARLHDLAWGKDPRAVETTQVERSIGAEVTFREDSSEISQIESRLLELADRCATRLRRQGVVGRVVSLKVRTSDFRTLTRSRTLGSPTDVARDVYLVARELFSGVDLRGLDVRLVGIRVEDLRERAGSISQPTLEDAVLETSQGRRDAEAALDLVRGKFGSAAISMGAAGLRRSS